MRDAAGSSPMIILSPLKSNSSRPGSIYRVESSLKNMIANKIDGRYRLSHTGDTEKD